MPSQSHSQRRCDSGSRRKSPASITGGSSVERLEEPDLLEQADVVRLAGLPRADVGGDHLGGVADQQHVAEPVDPVQRHVGEQVVGHLLRVVHGGGVVGLQRADHRGGVGRLRGDHLVAAGVVEAGADEVGGVEGLVDDRGVGSVLPGAHHRRGDVPRTGPHRHPDDRHGSVIRATGRRRRRPRAAGRAPAAGARPARAHRCRSCARRRCGPAPRRRRCRSRTPRPRCRRR